MVRSGEIRETACYFYFSIQISYLAAVSRLPTIFLAKNCQSTDLNHQNLEFGGPLKSQTRHQEMAKFSTGPQLSEYVQVFFRNTNGTCLKSVSKTPTLITKSFGHFNFRMLASSESLNVRNFWCPKLLVSES